MTSDYVCQQIRYLKSRVDSPIVQTRCNNQFIDGPDF